jgi:hypothetical protein
MAKKSTDNTPKLEIKWVKISELIPADYNPRKITPKRKKELIESFEKFGFRIPVSVNQHPDRMNIIIGGHQRISIWADMGNDIVPTTYEYLDLEDEKEANLRWNKNSGDFDMEKVQEMFNTDKLLEIGFAGKDLNAIRSDFEQKFDAIDTQEPVYPIVAKYSEKYDCVMIFCSKEIDFTWLANILELKTEKDYKSTQIGLSKVITVEKFQKLYKQWTSK